MKLIKRIVMRLVRDGAFKWLPDELFLRLVYRCTMNQRLDLKSPKRYTEKLQWMKLYDRNPLYVRLVDKQAVKSYVRTLINERSLGDLYVIPTLGVWSTFDDIDFNTLPNQFVLKCTHDSGGLVICTDKSKFDYNAAKAKIEAALKRDYYKENREWPYKNVPRRIIAEKYMVDESGYELKDYKFFVFNGKVKAMFIATDRNATTDTCFDFFDRDFTHLPVQNGHPNAANQPQKPPKYERMVAIAEELGRNLPHARIDFYNINGDIYFGEYTFFHWSGFVKFDPDKWDYEFGEWLRLPSKEAN